MTERPDQNSEMVTIPRAEYEALRTAVDALEDASAVAEMGRAHV